MHREIVTVHVGQAGIQAGNAVWELMCLEHGMQLNGTVKQELTKDELQSLGTVFSQIEPHEKFVPRTIYADLEPTVIDEVRVGAYKDLYSPDSLLASYEDASGNFARGYYSLGCKAVGALVSSARKAVEACDQFQGFMTMASLGGGTGSGLLAMFTERATLEFAGRRCMQFSIIPSQRLSTSPVEVYNAIHHLYRSQSFCDINCIFDNEALYDICTNQLSVTRPTYTSVNRVIAPLIAGVTASMRFKSQLNAHIEEYLTNLVPFPKAHFPVLSFAPFCTDFVSQRCKLTTEILTNMVFDQSHRTVTANLTDGMAMATCLTYRGQHSIANVSKVIQRMRNSSMHIVRWCPTGFKIAFTPQPPVSVPGMGPDKVDRSVVMLTNNTAIALVMERMAKAYKNLATKKAFIHWYVGEGMEESEFSDAYDAVLGLVADILLLEEGEEHSKSAVDENMLGRKSRLQKKNEGGSGSSKSSSFSGGGGGGHNDYDDKYGGNSSHLVEKTKYHLDSYSETETSNCSSMGPRKRTKAAKNPLLISPDTTRQSLADIMQLPNETGNKVEATEIVRRPPRRQRNKTTLSLREQVANVQHESAPWASPIQNPFENTNPKLRAVIQKK